MAENDTKIKVTVIIPSSQVEHLKSFVNYSGGEVLKETKIRKRKRIHEDKDCAGGNTVETAACQNYNLGAPYGETDEPTAFVQCEYCLEAPCITSQSRGKPSFLSAYGPPRLQNISKRYQNYRYYHRILKKEGLWNNPIYLLRKYELGVHIEDVREVMPNCVVNDVRKRWPNPPEVPYKGHVPTL